MKRNVSLVSDSVLRQRFGGVSAMWVHRRRKDGTLPPPVKIGKRNFTAEHQLDEVMDRLAAASEGRAPEAGS